MTAAQKFADFGASLNAHPLSADILHHTKRAVVDWYSAVIPGAVEQPAKILEAALVADLDRGGSKLALGRAATVRAAALINGTAAHTVEVDDIYRHAIYHPGAPTIAAALAQAQALNATGLGFMRAVIAGYEISTRIGAALGREHYRFWHSTGTAGAFGAAAAGATLLQLDASRYAHALCTVATMASGLQQAFKLDSMSKPLHAGHAADAGLLAASAAQAGFTGSLDVLDGSAGMGMAMSNNPDWATAVATLGKDFHIADMTFKNHACCGHTFAAIDGALVLKAQMGVSADQISQVAVATYAPALAVAGNKDPQTAAEARFSLPYVVATALVHGSVRLAAFSTKRLQDPDVRDLMQNITLTVDPVLDQAFPGQRAARVSIKLKNGETSEFFQPTRKGDPEAPLSDGDLNEKFIELASPVLGMTKATNLLDQLWHLEQLPAVRAL